MEVKNSGYNDSSLLFLLRALMASTNELGLGDTGN